LFITPIGNFDLNKIKKVIYLLHHTFPERAPESSDPSINFSINLRCWGDFYAMAIIIFKEEKKPLKLIKWLPLE